MKRFRAEEVYGVRTSSGNCYSPIHSDEQVSCLHLFATCPVSQEDVKAGWCIWSLRRTGLVKCLLVLTTVLHSAWQQEKGPGRMSPSEVTVVWTLQFHLSCAERSSVHFEEHQTGAVAWRHTLLHLSWLQNLNYKFSQAENILVGKMEVKSSRLKSSV